MLNLSISATSNQDVYIHGSLSSEFLGKDILSRTNRTKWL